MFRTVRFILRIVVVFLIALLVLAYFTNPTMDEFKAEAKQRFNELVQTQKDDPTLKAIAALSETFADQVVDKMVVRKNYYICSVYVLSMPDGDYSFLGAYHMFVPLQSKSPFETIKQTVDQWVN